MNAQEQTSPNGWRVFHGTGRPPVVAPALPQAPPWRRFLGAPSQPAPPDEPEAAVRRLGPGDVTPQLGPDEIDTVNAALLLRRPLLITGPPGIGKSTLAYVISRELGLGRVLEWSIVSRTTLRGRAVHDAWAAHRPSPPGRPACAARRPGNRTGPDRRRPTRAARRPYRTTSTRRSYQHTVNSPPVLGDFITLGALGTALLPYDRPRVLLVDELDKSDIDLPNDLLHVLENGSYDVPELVRDAVDTARVHTSDPAGQALVRGGRVECREFPVVVITSNGERGVPRRLPAGAACRWSCVPQP
ncbi:MoxR family ATPase [Streptomyces thinghirensis]|nr:MoxR family ATPase [Streptomyces thinghirensis]